MCGRDARSSRKHVTAYAFNDYVELVSDIYDEDLEDSVNIKVPHLKVELSFTESRKKLAVVALLARFSCRPTFKDDVFMVRCRIPAKLVWLLQKLDEMRGDLRKAELKRILKNPSMKTLESVLALRKLVG